MKKCLGFLDQINQAKMQWVHDPNQSSVDTLNNVRHKASKHFKNTMKEYLKVKIEVLTYKSIARLS
jgi:hypothetical protein